MKKILLFLAVILITGCQEKEKMNISKLSLEYEYGSAITSEEILSYLENTDKYIEEVVINFPQNEEGNEYVSVGEHDVEIIHGEETGMIKVLVKDTVAPVFKNVKESYTIEYGKSFTEEIKADDLSDVTITIDDSKVNYKKAGDYKATVKAVDIHGNETEKEISITVKEEKKEEKKEISSSATSSSSAGKGNSSKPAVNSSSSASKTENNKNNTSSSANKKPSSSASNKTESQKQDSSSEKGETIFTYEDPVIDMTTHVHDGPAVENKYFDDPDVLDEWAMHYRYEQYQKGTPIGCAYGVSDCKCGMMYINRFY